MPFVLVVSQTFRKYSYNDQFAVAYVAIVNKVYKWKYVDPQSSGYFGSCVIAKAMFSSLAPTALASMSTGVQCYDAFWYR